MAIYMLRYILLVLYVLIYSLHKSCTVRPPTYVGKIRLCGRYDPLIYIVLPRNPFLYSKLQKSSIFSCETHFILPKSQIGVVSSLIGICLGGSTEILTEKACLGMGRSIRIARSACTGASRE